MIYRVVHKTVYLYGGTVSQCHNVAYLEPREVAGQRCLNHRLEIDPLPVERVEYRDFFGNPVTYFSIQQPHQQLTVTGYRTDQWRRIRRGRRSYSHRCRRTGPSGFVEYRDQTG